ncbi:hypothetical protein WMF18_26455 [Sorangium sp. So ce315]|uniref:hypothetical protein n=1 Tax=Sorangium sp. So ce315 TaxID=3133299 RepID=UPI003F5D8A28
MSLDVPFITSSANLLGLEDDLMKTLGFAAILVSMCAMAACTVTSGGGDGGAGGEGGEGGATTTSTSSTTTGGGEGGGGGGEGGGDATNECAPLELNECVECCQTEHASEAETFEQLTFWHCGCEVERCAAICDTEDAATDVCGDGIANLDVDNPNCAACVAEEAAAETSECYDAAYTACGEEGDCQALTECSDACE